MSILYTIDIMQSKKKIMDKPEIRVWCHPKKGDNYYHVFDESKKRVTCFKILDKLTFNLPSFSSLLSTDSNVTNDSNLSNHSKTNVTNETIYLENPEKLPKLSLKGVEK